MEIRPKNIEKVREPKKKSFDIVRAAKAAGVAVLVAGARMADAIPTQSVKDNLSLPQITNSPRRSQRSIMQPVCILRN